MEKMLEKIIKIFEDLGIKQRTDTGIGYPELILAESCHDNKIQDTKILYIPWHYINDTEDEMYIPVPKIEEWKKEMEKEGYFVMSSEGDEFLNGDCYKFLIVENKKENE